MITRSIELSLGLPYSARSLARWLTTFTFQKHARVRPSDGLVSFAVVWAFAMLLSLAAPLGRLAGEAGIKGAVAQWACVLACLTLILRPAATWRLLLVSLAMACLYV